MQTVFKAAIGGWVRGRCQNGVSDGKLTDDVDKLGIDLEVIHRVVDNLIDCPGANGVTGLNSERGMRWAWRTNRGGGMGERTRMSY